MHQIVRDMGLIMFTDGKSLHHLQCSPSQSYSIFIVKHTEQLNAQYLLASCTPCGFPLPPKDAATTAASGINTNSFDFAVAARYWWIEPLKPILSLPHRQNISPDAMEQFNRVSFY